MAVPYRSPSYSCDRDRRDSLFAVDVEPDAQVLAHAVADTAAVESDVIGPIRHRHVRAGLGPVFQPLPAKASHDIDRPVDLLGDRHARARQHVVGLIDIVGRFDAAPDVEVESRRSQKGIGKRDRRREAVVILEIGRGCPVGGIAEPARCL